MDSGELTFLVLEWSMDGIGCQKMLLPQHQSTVLKDAMIDLFASQQQMTTLEPLKKRAIHGHNCLQRSVSDDDDDDVLTFDRCDSILEVRFGFIHFTSASA